MKSTSTDGKFFAWKQSDKKWYSFNEVRNAWDVLPGQNKAGDTYTIPDLSLEMIWVEPGTFIMGSPDDEEGRSTNETQHEVTLTKGYWLGKYEVKQTQWEKVMNYNPSYYNGANRPVEVTVKDAKYFCRKLTYRESEARRLPAGMAYQLPTEAQWEYACRAGTTTAYYWGATIDPSYANYGGSGIGQTCDVGEYAANPWGFYDMHGNVSEWCADLYGSSQVPVYRGGNWHSRGSNLRSARLSHNLRYAGGRIKAIFGFRAALSAPPLYDPTNKYDPTNN